MGVNVVGVHPYLGSIVLEAPIVCITPIHIRKERYCALVDPLFFTEKAGYNVFCHADYRNNNVM